MTRTEIRHRVRASALILLLVLAGTAPSRAVDYYWNGPDGGAFTNAVHWLPYNPTPPLLLGPGGASDSVHFDRGVAPQNRYTVTQVSGANERMFIHHDALMLIVTGYALSTPTAGIPTLVVGVNDGDVADLVLNGQGGATLTNNRFVTIAQSPGSTGYVTVTGGGWLWNAGTQMQVGHLGQGFLVIENGGTVACGSTQVGMFAGSMGAAAVRGVGSSLTVFAGHNVGGIGTGVLAVLDGATLTTGSSSIGGGVTGHGTMIVRGDGSEWIHCCTVFFGYNGSGTLFVEEGGRVTNTGTAWLGGWDDEGFGSGEAVITGLNSIWDIQDGLTVGVSGTGNMLIDDGGAVQSAEGWLGLNPGSTGAATINGAGAHWTMVGDLFVGDGGDGDLVIEAGALVSNTNGWLGVQAGAVGTATIRGFGSLWDNQGELFIGASGTGVLRIEDQGAVVNQGTWIGTSPGANGAAVVTGGGSNWSSSDQFIVGYRESGHLLIEQGASVSSAGNGFVGFVVSQASNSSATVTGSGSSWHHNGHLDIGQSTAGTLNIADGAALTVVSAHLGRHPGAVGHADVSGGGSTWTVQQNLVVGSGGEGRLKAYLGGSVDVGGSLTIGANGLVCGNVSIGGGVFNEGTLAPEVAPTAMQIGGGFAQIDEGQLQIRLGGPTEFGRLGVEGSVVLGGTLRVLLDGGFVPTVGAEFDIIETRNKLVGSFQRLRLPHRILWDISRLNDEGILSVIGVRVPGDCQDDGHAGLDDFAHLVECLDGPAEDNEQVECDCADINGDGVIDLADVADFQVGFSSVVNEP